MENINKKNYKELEKLFRYTKELEKIRDNVKILLENQDAIDNNQKDIKKGIDEKDKELRKLTRYQKIGKAITLAGGGLALSSSITGGVLKSVGYSEIGDLLPLIGSGVGGLMSLTGSGIELYISEKEKSHQENKKKLEIEEVERIKEKHYRDLNRLKDNWGKLDDIYERLFWLFKTTKFSDEVDEIISTFLFKVNFERFVEEKKHELGMEQQLLVFKMARIATSDVVGMAKLEKIQESKQKLEEVRKDKDTFWVFSDFWKEINASDIINNLVMKVKEYRQEIFKDEEKIEITSDNTKIHTLDKIVEETKEIIQQSDELEIQIEQPPK